MSVKFCVVFQCNCLYKHSFPYLNDTETILLDVIFAKVN